MSNDTDNVPGKDSLVVPITLDALVVNDAVKDRDTFRNWRFDYQHLNDFASPEPDPGDDQIDEDQTGVHLHWTLPRSLRHGPADPLTGEPRHPLVPNRWLVARFGGTATRTLTAAWVVESDCPNTTPSGKPPYPVDRSSAYLVPPDLIRDWQRGVEPYRKSVKLDAGSKEPQVAYLGMAFELPGWQQQGDQEKPVFLTAIAPGNPQFSSYTRHNANVLSFHDRLTGIKQDTLSYTVIGWYSNPAVDAIVPGKHQVIPAGSAKDLLAALGWTVAKGKADSGTEPTRSFYQGLALAVPWDRGGKVPKPDPLEDIRESKTLAVALGNTAEDAFLAIVERQLAVSPSKSMYPAHTLPLLRALLYDALPLANEIGGDARVRRRIEQAWFTAQSGGYRWTVAPPRTSGSGKASEGPEFVEPAWLAQLNADQEQLDVELGNLHAIQWEFNALWFKNGLLPNVSDPQPPDGAPTPEQLRDQLDEQKPGSLAFRLVEQLRKVSALAKRVPQPDPTVAGNAHEAWEAGVKAYAAARKGLPEGARLKAVPLPGFWRANNPVVTLLGVQPPHDTSVDRALTVRRSEDVVTALLVNGKEVRVSPGRGGMPAIPGADQLPGVVAGLLAECFLVDPANAQALSAANGLPVKDLAAVIGRHGPADYRGTLPGRGLEPWAQPWQPLFLEWKAGYHHIPYQVGKQRCWTFDGEDYRFTPGREQVPAGQEAVVGGVSALSPHPRSVITARLREFVKAYGDSAQRSQLDDWVRQIADWPVLSQELVGFNDRLAVRDTRAFRRPVPTDPAADLAGYPDAVGDRPYSLPARYRGHVGSVPYLPDGLSTEFHDTRQGQLCLKQLVLYDKFGRELWLISSEEKGGGLIDWKSFPLLVDENLAPDTSLTPDVAAVAQLPPRPLQGARLDFHLLDGMTGTPADGKAPAANPIGGWILPDHLDRGLLLYAPDGRSLGEYRLRATGQGQQAGQWEPPWDGSVTDLAGVGSRAPLVARLIASTALADRAGFAAFLDAVDSTLWGVDPLGSRADRNLSVLVGRPLALVPARLGFSLDGPVLTPTGWPDTIPDADWPQRLPKKRTGLLAHTFSVRLGSQESCDDGLIGYFAAGNFELFRSVASPAAADGQGFVRAIGTPGPGGGPEDTAYLELEFEADTPTDLVLLVDPRGSVHARTGVTPTTSVDLGSEHVDRAMAALRTGFHLGPALTQVQQTPAVIGHPPAAPEAVSLLAPSERHGSWSWWQPGTAKAYAVLPASSEARLKGLPTILADGVLQPDASTATPTVTPTDTTD